MNIKSLLDLTCMTVANMIKGARSVARAATLPPRASLPFRQLSRRADLGLPPHRLFSFPFSSLAQARPRRRSARRSTSGTTSPRRRRKRSGGRTSGRSSERRDDDDGGDETGPRAAKKPFERAKNGRERTDDRRRKRSVAHYDSTTTTRDVMDERRRARVREIIEDIASHRVARSHVRPPSRGGLDRRQRHRELDLRALDLRVPSLRSAPRHRVRSHGPRPRAVADVVPDAL